MHITRMDSGTGLRAGLQIFPIGVIAHNLLPKQKQKRLSRNPLPGVTSLETILNKNDLY